MLPDDAAAIDPATDPTWETRLDENTPDPSGVATPLFVAQASPTRSSRPRSRPSGSPTAAPPTCRPSSTGSPDVDHPAVVGPGGTDALSWTIDRFAGTTPPDEYPAG
jgi:hypothetical protein